MEKLLVLLILIIAPLIVISCGNGEKRPVIHKTITGEIIESNVISDFLGGTEYHTVVNFGDEGITTFTSRYSIGVKGNEIQCNFSDNGESYQFFTRFRTHNFWVWEQNCKTIIKT